MKQRIYNKGETVYTLLSSFNKPNTFIPVKAYIKDVKWDIENPRYLVKIIKFYDNIFFLKRHLFDMNFWHSTGNKPRVFRLKKDDFVSVISLEERLSATDQERFYIQTYSLLTTKNKAELKLLFEKIQYFMISVKYKEIKELSTRAFYQGVFKLDSEKEYTLRLKDFLRDQFFNHNEDLDKYLDSL